MINKELIQVSEEKSKCIEDLLRTHLVKDIEKIEMFSEGLFHNNYKISVKNERALVLRIIKDNKNVNDEYFRTQISIKKELEVIKILKDTDATIPEVYYSGSFNGENYYVSSLIEGIRFSQFCQKATPEEFLKAVSDLGAVLNNVHSLSFSSYGDIVSPSYVNWIDRIEDLLNKKINDPVIKQYLNEDIVAKIEKIFEKSRSELNAVKKPTIVIYDLHKDNFLVNNCGKIGFYDFDFSTFAPGCLDFIPIEFSVMNSLGEKYFKEARTAFYDSYNKGQETHYDEKVRQIHFLNHFLAAIKIYHGRESPRDTWSKNFAERVNKIVSENYVDLTPLKK